VLQSAAPAEAVEALIKSLPFLLTAGRAG